MDPFCRVVLTSAMDEAGWRLASLLFNVSILMHFGYVGNRSTHLIMHVKDTYTWFEAVGWWCLVDERVSLIFRLSAECRLITVGAIPIKMKIRDVRVVKGGLLETSNDQTMAFGTDSTFLHLKISPIQGMHIILQQLSSIWAVNYIAFIAVGWAGFPGSAYKVFFMMVFWT